MKITQASVLGLLGCVSAAATPRRPNMAMSGTGTLTNKYPLYTTIVAPTAQQIPLSTEVTLEINSGTAVPATAAKAATAEILANAYYDGTQYACFRKNMYYFPEQYILAGKLVGTSTAASGVYTADSVAAFSATTDGRTFWNNNMAEFGTNFSDEKKKIKVYAAPSAGNYWDQGLVAENSITAASTTVFKTANNKSTYGGNQASAGSWSCCNNIRNQMACNGGVDTAIDAIDATSLTDGGKSAIIKYRLFFKAAVAINDGINASPIQDTLEMGSTGIFPVEATRPLSTYVAAAVADYDLPKYNTDILLASMPQASLQTPFTPAAAYTTATAAATLKGATTSYCDYTDYEFTLATTPSQVFTTRNGFKGSTKCTYQMQMGHNLAAPAFKVTEAAYRNFLIHWIEWLVDADMGVQIMNSAAADTSVFKIGSYLTADKFKYLQPMESRFKGSSTNWPTTLIEYSTKVNDFTDPAKWYPGSPGNVVWMPNKTGALSKEQYSQFDSGLLMAMTNQITTGVAAFNAAKTTYEGLKTTYNKALKDEKARDAAATPDPIVIPVRPCPPSVVAPYSGPTLTNLDNSSGKTAQDVYAKVNGYQGMKTTLTSVAAATNTVLGKAFPYFTTLTGATQYDLTSLPTTAHQNRKGYLQGFDDATVTATTAKMAGHVFGRLGQSEAADKMKAFRWNKIAVAAADKAILQVSFFPEAVETGLTTDTKFIKFTASQQTWGSYSDFNAPTIPGAPTAPDAVSAVYLAATSTAAVALALATLY